MKENRQLGFDWGLLALEGGLPPPEAPPEASPEALNLASGGTGGPAPSPGVAAGAERPPLGKSEGRDDEWTRWARRPHGLREMLEDTVLQIKRDLAVINGDPTYHGTDPGVEFYRQRVAGHREDAVSLMREIELGAGSATLSER